jgi:lipooligosaccharide transport system ATP-binding protein
VTSGLPVAARGLVKRYGDIAAVAGVDLTVEPGDVFGYLGPNGAGKTTSLRMLLGLIRPSGGSAQLFGRDPMLEGAKALQGVAGFVEGPRFYPYLSGRRNLRLLADYDEPVSKSRIEEVLEIVELRDRAKDRVGGYSHGMRQRLGIAAALLRAPRLLLLDEPTTGLDPQARHLLWDRLYRLKQRGVTLVLTTHYMDEAEQLCDRLVIMDKAKIVAEGSPRQLIERYSTREVAELRFAPGVAEGLNGQLDGIAQRVEHLPDRVLLYADDGEAAASAVHRRGLRPETVLVRRSSLEDVFLRLTGRSLIE